jgi:hypothetical protein
MNKKISFSMMLVGILAFGLAFASCGGNSAFVGKWIAENNSDGPMELFKDGTGVSENSPFSWKIENKRFIMSSPFFAYTYDYEISEKKLTFTDENGKSYIYIKN